MRSHYPVVVFIDRKPTGYIGDCVLADGIGGAYEAVKTLILKGHSRIGLLTGELGITTSNERFDGYKKALADHDIPFDSSIWENGEIYLRADTRALR